MHTKRTQAAQAERRVRLVLRGQERQRFVRAGVQHTDHNLLAREAAEQLGVRLGLLFDARRLLVAEEQEFSAEQADAFGAVFECRIGVLRLADIGEQWDEMAVLGLPGLAAQLLGLGGVRLRLVRFGNLLVVRVDNHGVLRGVDHDGLPVLDVIGALSGYHGHDAAGTRQNGGVAGRTALAGNDG